MTFFAEKKDNGPQYAEPEMRDYYNLVYIKVGKFFGWSWKEFYFETPWWRIKEWDEILEHRTNSENTPLDWIEVMFLRALARVKLI